VLAARHEAFHTAGIVELIRQLDSPEFRHQVVAMPGYASAGTGKALEVQAFFSEIAVPVDRRRIPRK
jgi:hypothetical protein